MPWSTWTAVTSAPAAVASTSSAIESAPPDTAQVSGRSLCNWGHRVSSDRTRCSGNRLLQADTIDPQAGRADLVERRKVGRLDPTGIDRSLAADRLDLGDEPFPGRVLVQFAFETDEALDQPTERVDLAPALAQHPCEPCGRRNDVGAGAVHDDVAVTLQQRHQTGRCVEHRLLFGGGNDGDKATVAKALLGCLAVAERIAHGGHQPAGIWVGELDGVMDEAEEVLAHPGDTGELRAVGQLVEGDPQPELFTREAELVLEHQHVGTDEVHGALIGAAFTDE